VTQVASAAPAAADETMTPARLPDVAATATETVAPPTAAPVNTALIITATATVATGDESQTAAGAAAPAQTSAVTATTAGPAVPSAGADSADVRPEPAVTAPVGNGTLTPAPGAATTSTPVATTKAPLTVTGAVTASPVVPATVAPAAVESVVTVTTTVTATAASTVTAAAPVAATATATMTVPVVAADTTVTMTPVPVGPPTGEPVTAATLQQRWRWLESRYEGDILITPPASARYWLEWMDNGRMEIVADCNQGIGRYELAGADVTVTFIGMTMAACDDDSLGDLFVGDLRTVVGATMRGGQLVLELQNEAGQMLFVPAN
jgi:heat shock protein HslJ